MAIKRTAFVAGMCVVALSSAMAEMPHRNAPAPVGDQSWPIVLKEAKRNPHERLWSKQEIEQAQAKCMILLKDLEIDADYEAPLREGSDCGSPAPMRLMSIGGGAQRVVFAPAPTVGCEMIAGLAQWLQQDVQKLARKHLGAPVQRIEAMSSYSCRNAYGRSEGRLSEHGRANALDIAAFANDKVQLVSVEADWGLTQREIAERGHEPEATASAGRIEALGRPQALGAAPSQPAQAAAGIAPAPMGLQELKPGIPGILLFGGRPAMGFDGQSRLGGPKGPVVTVNKTEFLRAVHKAACRTFGTVLGPEANRTHRNHFHVDMAERAQQTRICE